MLLPTRRAHQSPAEAVWMPANTTVTQSARDDYSDDDDEDEDGRIAKLRGNGNDDSSDDSRAIPMKTTKKTDPRSLNASNAEVSEVTVSGKSSLGRGRLPGERRGGRDDQKMAKLGRRPVLRSRRGGIRLLRHARDDGDESRQPMDRNGEAGIDVRYEAVEGDDDEFEEVDKEELGSRKFSRQTNRRRRPGGKHAPDGDRMRTRAGDDDRRGRRRRRVGAATVDPVADGAAAGGAWRGGFGGRTCLRTKGRRARGGANRGSLGRFRARGDKAQVCGPAVAEEDAAEASPITSRTPQISCDRREPLAAGGGGVGTGLRRWRLPAAASAAAAARDATPNERSLPRPDGKPVFQLSAAAAARRTPGEGEEETGFDCRGVKMTCAHDRTMRAAR